MVDNERQAAVPALEVVNVKFPEITTLQVNHALLLDLLNVDVVKITLPLYVSKKSQEEKKGVLTTKARQHLLFFRMIFSVLLYTNYIKHLSLCPHFLLPTNCPLTVVWSLW